MRTCLVWFYNEENNPHELIGAEKVVKKDASYSLGINSFKSLLYSEMTKTIVKRIK